jgi:hypothetical protein
VGSVTAQVTLEFKNLPAGIDASSSVDADLEKIGLFVAQIDGSASVETGTPNYEFAHEGASVDAGGPTGFEIQNYDIWYLEAEIDGSGVCTSGDPHLRWFLKWEANTQVFITSYPQETPLTAQIDGTSSVETGRLKDYIELTTDIGGACTVSATLGRRRIFQAAPQGLSSVEVELISEDFIPVTARVDAGSSLEASVSSPRLLEATISASLDVYTEVVLGFTVGIKDVYTVPGGGHTLTVPPGGHTYSVVGGGGHTYTIPGGF